MDMQKIIAIGDKVDIKSLIKASLSDDQKVPVYASRILDVKENNVLQLAMPFHEGKVVPLAVNSRYEICIYAKNGLFTCNIVIIERYKSNNMFYMDAAVYTPLSKVQRREFFRYAYRTTIEYRNVPAEIALGKDDSEKETEEKASPWKSGIMMDLSGGGLRVISPIDEVKDSYIQVRFPIRLPSGTEMIVLYGHILRSLRVENNPQLRDLRVEFVHMNPIVQEKIVRFIFDEERRNLSKSRK